MTPVRILRLSNKALIEEFDVAYERHRGDELGEARLNLLSDEISRRERAGLLTGDDWIEGQSPVIERRYTRDAQIPIAADDPDLDHGWRCIPVPPTPDPRWQIFDTSPDYKTGWERTKYTTKVLDHGKI